MPSLTIKDLPKDLLDRLRELAESQNRSLDKEVIHLLLEAVHRESPAPHDALAREAQRQVAAWRELQKRFQVDLPDDIVEARTLGRPGL
jgi:plasmid stability protein